jgi:hypothetical protein
MYKIIHLDRCLQSKLTLSVPVTCTRLPLLVGVEIRSKEGGKKKWRDDGMMSIPACHELLFFFWSRYFFVLSFWEKS